jgi:hypothetical protein
MNVDEFDIEYWETLDEADDYFQEMRRRFVDLLRDSGTPGFRIGRGICGHMNTHNSSLTRLFSDWTYHSGDFLFPIPGGHKMFADCLGNDELWTGNQLMYRRSLIRHCIRKIDEIRDRL